MNYDENVEPNNSGNSKGGGGNELQPRKRDLRPGEEKNFYVYDDDEDDDEEMREMMKDDEDLNVINPQVLKAHKKKMKKHPELIDMSPEEIKAKEY